MSDFSNYAEDAIMDHLLGNTAFTMPTNSYVQLHTASPGEDCTTAVATENTRKILSWAAASSRSISTNAGVSWTSVAGTETYTHFSVWDALTAGNPLFYGSLTASQAVTAGDDFDIASGDITFDVTTGMLTVATGNSVLDHVTGRSAWTQPAGHFVKLHTGAPGTAATGNPATEATRADAGAFSASSGGASDNDAAITWTSVSTTETITDISGWDSVTGGIALYVGTLTASKALTSGQNAQFDAGTLDLALL